MHAWSREELARQGRLTHIDGQRQDGEQSNRAPQQRAAVCGQRCRRGFAPCSGRQPDGSRLAWRRWKQEGPWSSTACDNSHTCCACCRFPLWLATVQLHRCG